MFDWIRKRIFCNKGKHNFKTYAGVDHGLPVHGVSTVAMSIIDKCKRCGMTIIRDIDYKEVSLTPLTDEGNE